MSAFSWPTPSPIRVHAGCTCQTDGMFWRHPFLTILCVAYLGFVGWLTLRPSIYDGTTATLLQRALEVFANHEKTSWITFSTVEALANVGMFVPIGILLVLLFGRGQWWIAIAGSFVASCTIEVFQALYLPTRVADVHDVIHNTLGGIIGVLLAEIITWPKAHRMKRDRLQREQYEREIAAARGAQA
jgi:glycopeptide antibiotics resistance protein